jgi:hypothetical protein
VWPIRYSPKHTDLYTTERPFFNHLPLSSRAESRHEQTGLPFVVTSTFSEDVYQRHWCCQTGAVKL